MFESFLSRFSFAQQLRKYSIIELQPITKFQCIHCRRITDKVKCELCYPSPAFPHVIPYFDKRPPKDYDEYKKWDRWFTWRYLLEFVEDTEDIYQIGNLELLRGSLLESKRG